MSEVTNEWVINSGSGGMRRHTWPAGRFNCVLTEVKQIMLKRGEKFCDPSKGQSPDDMLPRVVFTFIPIEESDLVDVAPAEIAQLSAMFSPSFGERAKLPGFLSQLSADGQVPEFNGNATAFKNWCNMHVGYEYSVVHKPNDAKTRSNVVSIAFLGKGEVQEAKQVVAAKPASAVVRPQVRQAVTKQMQAAADVPFPNDDIHF